MRDGTTCPHGRDRATGTSRWILAIPLTSPCSAHRAGRTRGSRLWSPEGAGLSPHGYPGVPTAEGHVLGLPTGLNQTEQPVLRLAMAYRDEVVGLWQSPGRGGEGWHQLVAYPGRIAGQFQVRQGHVGTRALPPCPSAGAKDVWGAWAGAQLVPSLASCRQLIFSLTQPPACGAQLALDDVIFRNCGLEGESHVHRGETPAGIPRETGLGVAPGGALLLPTGSWVHLPGRGMGQVANPVPRATQGRMWGEPSVCWGPRGAGRVLTVCPTAPEPGQQVCGAEERHCKRGSCLAQHRFCDNTDDCGDGLDEDPVQCREHPWPRDRPPVRTSGLRVCVGWAKPGCGAGRGHLSSAPWLCGQRDKITWMVLWRGQPITGTSLGHSALPPSLQRTFPTAPLRAVSAAGRQRTGRQSGRGTRA